MTDAQDLYRRGVGEFDRRVRQVDDEQWGGPTPCSEWTVRDLVNHVVAEDLWVPPLLEGQTMDEVGDRFEGDVLGEDPFRAWSDAREAALAAAERTPPDRLVHTSMGEMPAADYLEQMFGDHLIHSWDLARAIGADDRLDPELVETCEEMMRPHEEMMRASGVFGDRVEVPDDADPQTRLLALCGRSE